MYDLKKSPTDRNVSHKSGSLCKDRGMLIKSNKNQLRDNITSKPAARLAGIPVSKWCKYAVELLHNDHLEGRRKLPLRTGGL